MSEVPLDLQFTLSDELFAVTERIKGLVPAEDHIHPAEKLAMWSQFDAIATQNMQVPAGDLLTADRQTFRYKADRSSDVTMLTLRPLETAENPRDRQWAKMLYVVRSSATLAVAKTVSYEPSGLRRRLIFSTAQSYDELSMASTSVHSWLNTLRMSRFDKNPRSMAQSPFTVIKGGKA